MPTVVSGAGLLVALLQLPQRLVRAMAGVALPPRPPREWLAERWRLMRLLPLAPRWVVGVLVAGNLASAVAPAILAISVGRLVGAVTAEVTGAARLAGPVALFGGALLARQLGQLVAETAGLAAARQIDRAVRRQLRQLALAHPTLTALEDPGFHDELHRASDLGVSWRVRSPGTAAVGQLVLMFRVAAAVAAAGVVAHFSIVLALTLLVLALFIRAIIRTQWIQLAALEDRFAPQKRRVAYWTDLATAAPAGKEVRLFGLGEWVTTRRHRAELDWLRVIWRAKDVVYGRQVWVFVLAGGFAAAAMLAPGIATLNGAIEVDNLAACLTAAWSVFAMSAMGHEAYDIEHGINAVHALDRLQARGNAPDGAAAPTRAPADLPTDDRPPSIRFVDVEFSYPGTGVRVLRGLTAEIRPGEVVALVGVNGAGKTSMMKLLAGLHRPCEGRIMVAGRDLSTVDPDRWRRRLSVLFQDFIQYPLTAELNVLCGAGGQPRDEQALWSALRDARADDLVRSLPDQEQTLLTRLRKDGVGLSGGQWQRLALARVLYALRTGAQILVLDEPTAHLDVQAEAAFFGEVIAAAAGASVVLISHRLSTVRHADRILLLSGGRITEAGTHDELVAHGGEYARLFQLQAARFQDNHADPAPEPAS